MANVKILIDFWNFQLSWNEHFPFDRTKGEGPTRIDWKGLPATLMGELPGALGTTQTPLHYRGASIYASVNPDPGGKDAKLKGFLHNIIGQMPGYQVHVFDRKERRTTDGAGTTVIKTVEKGVDTSIVTEIFSGAINGTYDVAMLISNDSDFCPAIKTIQDRLDKQIVHVGFRYGGDEIRSACWSHILLDGTVSGALKGS